MLGFLNSAFTWFLVAATIALLAVLFTWVYKQFFYMVSEPKVKRDLERGHYQSALHDLANIPESEGSSTDEAVAKHLRELCAGILNENNSLAQEVDRLKSKVTRQIQTRGNLEDRLRVAKSDSGVEYEKSLLQQLAKTYGLKIDHE